MALLKLHGIRTGHSVNLESVDSDGDQLQQMAAASNNARRMSVPAARPGTAGRNRNETLWKRRHSVLAAQKNNEWASFYLSTMATDTTIAGFLSIKGNPQLDAEYFYNFIPKAVANQDSTYKELLAVYNALRYWSGREMINGKNLLLSIVDEEACDLLKKAKLKGKVGAQKILILQEINEICQKSRIEMRMAELEGDLEEMIVFHLARMDQPDNKRQFHQMLKDQSRIKMQPFVAKEKLFPPAYVG